MSGLTLRPARIGDSTFLARLCREALVYDASPDAVAETLGRLSRQQDHTILLVERNGCPAGFIHTQRYEVLYAPAMMNVLGLAVPPDTAAAASDAPCSGLRNRMPSPGGSPPPALPPPPSGPRLISSARAAAACRINSSSNFTNHLSSPAIRPARSR